VEVVELPHARDAGREHLAVRRARQRVVGVGIEAPGDGVHLVAPGPERAPLALRASAEGAVERVAVAVGEAGEGETGDSFGGC